MLQKAGSEGWGRGYQPRRKAVGVYLRAALPAQVTRTPPASAVGTLPSRPRCLLAPAAIADLLGISQQLCWKPMDIKGEGGNSLNTDGRFSSEQCRKLVAFFSVQPSSFLLPPPCAGQATGHGTVRGAGGEKHVGAKVPVLGTEVLRDQPQASPPEWHSPGHRNSSGRWVARDPRGQEKFSVARG